MCLIIHADKKQPIPEFITSSAKIRNKDGWGVCWFNNNKLHAKRSLDMDSMQPFIDKLENFERIIHLRMSTHGHINMPNCHPFRVGRGLYFMHNGVMSEFDRVKGEASDTAQFVTSILEPIAQNFSPEKLLSEYWFRNMLDKYAGTSNKFALMDSYGRVHRSGTWTHHESGVWLSNTYAWSDPKKYTSTYSNRYNTSGYHRDNRYGGVGISSTKIDEWRRSPDYQDFWPKQVAFHLGQIDKEPTLNVQSYRDEVNKGLEDIITKARGTQENENQPNSPESLEFTADDLYKLPAEDVQALMETNPEWVSKLKEKELGNAEHTV